MDPLAPMTARSALLVALLACAAATATAARGDAPGRPPGVRGVLLISIDTLRADHVGGGDPAGSLTPALDALAAQGVWVENAFTPTPTTAPAHASLFTGLHPWNHRVLDNAVPMAANLPTLAEAARAGGYRTAAVVSSFVLDPRFGFSRGFEDYEFEQKAGLTWREQWRKAFYTRGEDTSARAIARLTEFATRPEERFFLFVHYFDPHYPYDPPPAYRVAPLAPVELAGKSLPDKVASMADLVSLIRAYRGEVRYTDAVIGRLLARLRVLGLEDETAVVVTADHGEGLGDHAHLGHGANLFNELVRVPLLIRAPGVPAGRRLTGPVQLEDLFPTLASLMGVAVPEGIDGVDLLPWLRGEVERSPRPAVVGRRKSYDDEPVIFYEWRSGSKWIGELGAEGAVYEAGRDSRELAADSAGPTPAWLIERVGDAAGSLADERRPALEPEVEEGLRALGYVE